MRHVLHTVAYITLPALLGMMMSYTAFAGGRQSPDTVPVNIFGDGNPDNGIEDSRHWATRRPQRNAGSASYPMNAGTLICDGKIRGTAMVLDTRGIAPGLKGVVLSSAAHVLFDLDTKQRYKRCEFNYMALEERPGYRVRIDMNHTRLGDYDPARATSGPGFGEGDWAFLYAARPWRGFHPAQSISVREFSYVQTESWQQSGGEIRLIAFDSSTGNLGVSRNCTVIESSAGDLGGGTWSGQFLDDCDSRDGASGGGLVAVAGEQQYLIGIRSGAHWSEQKFPSGEYPLGPPDGSVWDRQTNTNFGRAIDAGILIELDRFIRSLQKKKQGSV